MVQKITEPFIKKTIMAPMAGINTPAFCETLRDLGCPLIYTGLLTSHGLVRQNRKTMAYVSSLPSGVAFVAQIFGGVPEIMAEAAAALEATGRFAAIDINMGCPAPKVLKSNAGAGLMREPELAARIVGAAARAIKIPVTVKMRSGWDSGEINCVELAKRCAGEGAAAAALHPRTRTQGFTGRTDWRLVAEMKERLEIPVIGSGDISSPSDAAARMAETGCDAVMIGRAARGDPGLIGRTLKLLDGGEPGPAPSPIDRISIALRHFARHIEIEGPENGVKSIRGQLSWYLKGIPGAAALRAAINKSETPDEVAELINDFRLYIDKNQRSML